MHSAYPLLAQNSDTAIAFGAKAIIYGCYYGG